MKQFFVKKQALNSQLIINTIILNYNKILNINKESSNQILYNLVIYKLKTKDKKKYFNNQSKKNKITDFKKD